MVHRKVLLLINPKSRQGEQQREEATRHLKELGLEVVTPAEAKPEQFSELIKKSKEQDQVDIVVVGGGDGSMACAIKGLRETKLPLGILPLGTANNLARNLNIPTDLKEACKLIKEGPLRQIDIGMVNNYTFFNVAGIGLSTKINKEVSPWLKRLCGPLAYGMAGLGHFLFRTRPFKVRIESPGKDPLVSQSFQITVCNGQHFGSGIKINEGAEIDDALLDLFTVKYTNWWRGIALLSSLLKGDHHLQEEVTLLRAREFVLYTKHPMQVDTDGEITTHTPAHFSVLPHAIEVVAPLEGPPSI